MKRYKNYKTTSYEWVEGIPAHWNELFLQQVCNEKCVKNTDNNENKVLSLSYGRIIRKKNIDAGLTPKSYSTYQIVDPFDIIMRLTDLQNDQKSLRTGLVREKGIITSAYLCLHSVGNAEYLQYVLHSYDTKKVFYGMGGGVRQSIGYADLRHMSIPVPPREEQDQIARYLNWKISEINRLIHGYQKQIALLKERRIAIETQFTTCGIGQGDLKDSDIYWLDRTPNHWKTVRLKQILKKESRLTGEDAELLICSNKGTVFKRGDSKMGLVASSDDIYQGVKKGDLLIHGMDTWHGAIAVSELEGMCTPVVHVCTSKDNNADVYYIAYYLRMMAYNKVFKAISNGVRQNTSDFRSWDKAGAILIPLPPIDEQTKIVKILNHFNQKVKKEIELIERQISYLREYRTRLISDVVTGQIDVRDVMIPEYETETDYTEDSADMDDSESEGSGDE